jgi:hypothetical protein
MTEMKRKCKGMCKHWRLYHELSPFVNHCWKIAACIKYCWNFCPAQVDFLLGR